MKIYLIVEKDKIAKFKYQCQSCIFCQASVSLLSRKATSKSVEKVKNFLQRANNYFEQKRNIFDKEWQEFDKIMTKNNIARKECLLLPLKAMLNALNS
jgi:nitrogen fixation NifU-like protein